MNKESRGIQLFWLVNGLFAQPEEVWSERNRPEIVLWYACRFCLSLYRIYRTVPEIRLWKLDS